MNREEAQQRLSDAGTPQERVAAIKAALSAGIPLNEIEQYLDWLDNARLRLDSTQQPEQRHSPNTDNAASGSSDSSGPDQQGGQPADG